MNVADSVGIIARNRPVKLAIREGQLDINYARLNQRINGLVQGLLSLGIRKGSIVAIVLPSCHEHLEALFALARLGAVSLPIDKRMEKDEVERTLRYFDASAAIFSPDKTPTFLELLGKLRTLENSLICTGEQTAPGIINYEKLLESSTQEEYEFDVDENDVFLIGLSSGTTGLPKGSVLTHRNMIYRWLGQIVEFGINSSDVFLNVTPMQYSAGRSFAMSHIFVGGTVVILGERFDPEATLEAIEKEKITTCFMVPTMYYRVLQTAESRSCDTKSIRAIISSGAKMPVNVPELIIQKLSPRFYNYFGSIEGGGISILKPEDVFRKSDSVGQGIFNTEIRIMDEKGAQLPLGHVGMIMGRGPAVATGYYKNPEATKEYFPQGWCRMGDLGRMDDEGFLYIEGREKDMIIRGGVNIYPTEIEEILQSHPLVDEAAIIGIPDQEYGEAIAAIIVLRPDQHISGDEIIHFCEKNLALYKRPKMVIFTSVLPKTSSGKVIKKNLKDMYLRGELK
jgi:fatty-acyl-CoA synthase